MAVFDDNPYGGLQGLAGLQQQAQQQGLRDVRQAYILTQQRYIERDYFTPPPSIKTTFKDELQCDVDLWLADIDI